MFSRIYANIMLHKIVKSTLFHISKYTLSQKSVALGIKKKSHVSAKKKINYFYKKSGQLG